MCGVAGVERAGAANPKKLVRLDPARDCDHKMLGVETGAADREVGERARAQRKRAPAMPEPFL